MYVLACVGPCCPGDPDFQLEEQSEHKDLETLERARRIFDDNGQLAKARDPAPKGPSKGAHV